MTALVRAAELPRSSTYMSAGEQDLVPGFIIIDIAHNCRSYQCSASKFTNSMRGIGA